MDIDHYLLKVNPPRTTPHKRHSVSLRVAAMVHSKRRMLGESPEANLLADVIIYKHFIP